MTLLLYFILITSPAMAQELLTPIDVKETAIDLSNSTGFTSTPETAPLSASSYSQTEIQTYRIERLSDLTRLDASLTESYSAGGYWDILSLRGLPLDNRANYLREGLPISAETSIPLDNKERVDIVKGPVGITSGAPTPAGLIHLSVKRPTSKNYSRINLSWSEANQQLLGLETNRLLSDKLSTRLQAVIEKIAPPTLNSEGQRHLVAGAIDYRWSSQSLWQFEVEASKQSRPSVAGFSLLGDKLPSVPDMRRNLNQQDWSRPVEFKALTSTLKNTTSLTDSILITTTLGIQHLRTDDYLAYPYGCDKEGRYDRYCSDGTFDVYDYRSENERRRTTAARMALEGSGSILSLERQWNVGALWSERAERYGKQAYNYAGEGNTSGDFDLPDNPSKDDQSTQRNFLQRELFWFEQLSINKWQLNTKLSMHEVDRSSERTDRSEKAQLKDKFAIPWLAISHQGKFTSYLSYGQGSELFITPNRSDYNRAGKSLERARSEQWEVGLKTQQWSLATFYLKRPALRDEAPLYDLSGYFVQKGLEASTLWEWKKFSWQQSAMLVQIDRSDNLKVTNVPQYTWRSHIGYKWNDNSLLTLSSVYEGEREIETNGQTQLAAWVRWDMSLNYRSWHVRVENIFANRYWRESPTQYGHIYLYPGIQRQVSLSWNHRW
jgi:iron complex outermembrane receptor protein